MRIAGFGVSIDLPGGWDGRVYSRPLAPPAALPPGAGEPLLRIPAASGGAATLHAANFALPDHTGDFGTGATAKMPADGVFLALVEYQTGEGLEPGRGLFAHQGPPARLRPSDFDPSALLLALAGQAGVQRFFTAAGRPFCLYAVIGSLRRVAALAPQASLALRSVAIAAR
jgi:hypothetical protein